MSESDRTAQTETRRYDSRAIATAPTLQEYLRAFRRWWFLILATSLVAGSTAWWVKSSPPPLYSAEVLLQRAVSESPLEGIGSALGSQIPQELIGSDLEILQSRSVLLPVVEALGLQVNIHTPGLVRNEVFEDLSVSVPAPAGQFVLDAADGRLLLAEPVSGDTVARGSGPYLLEMNGLRLRVSERARELFPVGISVLRPEEALDDLRGQLRITHVRGTTLIRLRHASPDPELSAAIVNAIAGSYQRQSAIRARESASLRREFISSQVAQVYDSLQAAQAVLLEYQDAAQMLDPRFEGQALADAYMVAQNDLREIRFQESTLEGLLASLGPDGNLEQGFQRVVALGSELVPGGAEIYARLQELKEERSRLTDSRFGYTDSGAQVEVMDSLISEAQSEIRALSEESLRVFISRREETELRVSDLRGQVGALPTRSSTFAQLQQRVDAVQDIFDRLVQNYYEAQIAEAVEGGKVEVIDPAPVPFVPDPTGTRMTVAFALFAGLLGGIGLSLVLEYLDTSIRSREEAERASGTRVLAYIPRLNYQRNSTQTLSLVDPLVDDFGAEAFRGLRTNLRFAKGGSARVILVTSPAPGEGKSTIVANLAAFLGREGHRVLLIDADLRRPVLHNILGVSREPGLSDFFQRNPSRAVRLVSPDGLPLSFLPCGPPTDTPAEFLGSQMFSRIIDSAREKFDFVLVDSPPILAVTDATLIGSSMDGIILVAKISETDRRALQLAAETLGRLDSPILGLVLNAVPRSGGQYQYGGYYGKYYRKYRVRAADPVSANLGETRDPERIRVGRGGEPEDVGTARENGREGDSLSILGGQAKPSSPTRPGSRE